MLAGIELKLDAEVLCRLCGLLESSISSCNDSSTSLEICSYSAAQEQRSLSARPIALFAEKSFQPLGGSVQEQQQQQDGHANLQLGLDHITMLSTVLPSDLAVTHRCVEIVQVCVDNPVAADLFTSTRVKLLMGD